MVPPALLCRFIGAARAVDRAEGQRDPVPLTAALGHAVRPVLLGEAAHHQQAAGGRLDPSGGRVRVPRDQPVLRLELELASFTEGEHRDRRLPAEFRLVVAVVADAVVLARHVAIEEHRVVTLPGGFLDLLLEALQQPGEGLRLEGHARVGVGTRAVPRHEAGLLVGVAAHDHVALLPLDRLCEPFEYLVAAVGGDEAALQLDRRAGEAEIREAVVLQVEGEAGAECLEHFLFSFFWWNSTILLERGSSSFFPLINRLRIFLRSRIPIDARAG